MDVVHKQQRSLKENGSKKDTYSQSKRQVKLPGHSEKGGFQEFDTHRTYR